jgi:hypothetical protein
VGRPVTPPLGYVEAAGAFWAGGCGSSALLDAVWSVPNSGSNGAVAGRVPDEVLAEALTMRGLRPLSRTARLAMVAAAQAWESAGVGSTGSGSAASGSARDAVVFGSRWASVGPLADFVRVAVAEGPDQVFPMAFPNTVASVHGGYVASLLGLGGPNVSVCGPAAGFEAVVEGVALLSAGRADRVLAVAAEALDPVVEAGTAGPSPRGEAAGALRLARRAWPDARLAPLAAVLDARVAATAAELPGVPAGQRWCADVQRVTGCCEAADGMLHLVGAAEAVRRTGRILTVIGDCGVRGAAAITLGPPD